MAKRKAPAKKITLPVQFQTPAPKSEKELEQASPFSCLADYLATLLRKWDDVRKEEIIPVWTRAWKNFNSIDDGDDEEAGRKQNRGRKSWRSKAFYPITEQKVMAAASQIDDVLFRTGNFPYDMKLSPISDAGQATVTFDESLPVTERDAQLVRAQQMAAAKLRLMKTRVDDQLAECRAIDQGRIAVFMAALYGCAFIETPITERRVRNIWEEGKGGKFVNRRKEEDVPAFRTLDNWGCWPDPDCDGDVQKGRGFFYGQPMTLADLIALYDQVFTKADGMEESYEYDFIRSEFDALLRDLQKPEDEPSERQMPERGEDRPWISRSSRDHRSSVEVFTWAGSVANKKLVGVIDGITEDDGYSEVIVKFCGGRILKASLNPYTGGRRPYTIVPFTKVPGSCWGRGVAQKIFDVQGNINRLLRMYIDNKRLSGNLMTAIDKSKLKKGETLEIYPGRNWEFEQGYQDSDVRKFLQPVTFPDVTQGVLEAIQMMLVWADYSSGIPRILEGSDTQGQETAYAENQRIIAASKQLGLVLKNLDRYGWVPIVESFYDWNMEFCEKEDLKGDFRVVATGYASFESKTMKKLDLERMLIMGQQMPVLASRLKVAPVVEDWFQTSSLDVDRYLRTEQEAQVAAEQQQKQQLDEQAAMLQFQQALKDRDHAAELEQIRAKAEFSGAVRTQLEGMRGEMKQITDRMKIEAQKLIKAAELELGLKKLEVQSGKTEVGSGARGGAVDGRKKGFGQGRGNRGGQSTGKGAGGSAMETA